MSKLSIGIRRAPGLVAGLAALAAPLAAFADGTYGRGSGHMWGDGSMMFFGPLMMILFVVLIVALVVVALRGLSPGHPSGGAPRGALDILDERFARGEIDAEEYRSRKSELSSR
jgi:putative membrane protein